MNIKKISVIFLGLIIIVLLVLIASGFNFSKFWLSALYPVATKQTKVATLEDSIELIWKNKKENIKEIVSVKNNPQNLYNADVYLYNLLKYAEKNNKKDILDDIAYVLLPASSVIKWTDVNNNEVILSSANFLFLVSDEINIISKIPKPLRTANMNNFVEKFSPIAMDHYKRWILDEKNFQVSGWGCGVGNFNHKDFLAKKLTKSFNTSPSYCNVVDDTDLSIIGGVSNMLSANTFSPKEVVIANRQQFIEYMNTATQLIKSRTNTNIVKINYIPRIITNFGVGEWKDHPDYWYAGYTGSSFPTGASKKDGVGWDSSHGRIIIRSMVALYNNRPFTQQSFPTFNEMLGLANNFVYVMFNGDYKNPKFSNYMDGTNGWYRFGYSGRKGFGYGPSDASFETACGYYSLLSVYNYDVKKVIDSAKNYYMSISTTTRGEGEGFSSSSASSATCYSNYARSCNISLDQSNSLDLLRLFAQ